MQVLQEALQEIKLIPNGSQKPSEIARHYGILISITDGHSDGYAAFGAVQPHGRITLGRQSRQGEGFSEYGEFCIAHELAHYFGWKKGLPPWPNDRASHWYLERYPEAFAAILTENQALAVLYDERGIPYEGEDLSNLLAVIMVEIKRGSM